MWVETFRSRINSSVQAQRSLPPLGGSNACPLCRALGLAKRILPLREVASSGALTNEIDRWIKDWNERPLVDWRRAGSEPKKLPRPRRIKFGKEWGHASDDPVPYEVEHATSTGLSAMTVEIMRATSYKDAVLKIIDKPWNQGSAPGDPGRSSRAPSPGRGRSAGGTRAPP